MKQKYRRPFFIWGTLILITFFYFFPLDPSPFSTTTTDPHFSFLLFPSHANVQIYADIERSQPLSQILDRSVTTEFQELTLGTVGVVLKEATLGYVDAKDLTFVPPVNSEAMIEKWRQTLEFQGYTRAYYSSKPLPNNQIETTLELVDDDHVRSHTYTYITKANQLIETKPVKLRTAATALLKLVYLVKAEAVLVVAILILCRKK